MNDRFYSTLSLCMRAGKLAFGIDTVKETVKSGKVSLLLTAADSSEKTVKEVAFLAEKNSIPHLKLDRTKSGLKTTIGKLTGVLAVTDDGLSSSLLKAASSVNRSTVHFTQPSGL